MKAVHQKFSEDEFDEFVTTIFEGNANEQQPGETARHKLDVPETLSDSVKAGDIDVLVNTISDSDITPAKNVDNLNLRGSFVLNGNPKSLEDMMTIEETGSSEDIWFEANEPLSSSESDVDIPLRVYVPRNPFLLNDESVKDPLNFGLNETDSASERDENIPKQKSNTDKHEINTNNKMFDDAELLWETQDEPTDSEPTIAYSDTESDRDQNYERLRSFSSWDKVKYGQGRLESEKKEEGPPASQTQRTSDIHTILQRVENELVGVELGQEFDTGSKPRNENIQLGQILEGGGWGDIKIRSKKPEDLNSDSDATLGDVHHYEPEVALSLETLNEFQKGQIYELRLVNKQDKNEIRYLRNELLLTKPRSVLSNVRAAHPHKIIQRYGNAHNSEESTIIIDKRIYDRVMMERNNFEIQLNIKINRILELELKLKEASILKDKYEDLSEKRLEMMKTLYKNSSSQTIQQIEVELQAMKELKFCGDENPEDLVGRHANGTINGQGSLRRSFARTALNLKQRMTRTWRDRVANVRRLPIFVKCPMKRKDSQKDIDLRAETKLKIGVSLTCLNNNGNSEKKEKTEGDSNSSSASYSGSVTSSSNYSKISMKSLSSTDESFCPEEISVELNNSTIKSEIIQEKESGTGELEDFERKKSWNLCSKRRLIRCSDSLKRFAKM